MSQQFTTDRLEALFDGGLPAQRGEWREVRFFSRALGQEAAYLAWVPPGYGTSQRAYPTLYLLHGVGSGAGGFGPEEWLGYALTEDLDRMLALDLIQPMIVILPNGEQGYWMNHADGGPKWGDFVAVDLVRHVDATFRTEPVRQRRAIGGLSMGAHGALQLALNHPDVFGVAGAHSPTLRPFEASPEFFGDQKWFAKHDPLSLVRNTNAAPRIATWIDVGATDDWRSGAEALRKAYEAKRAPLEFRVLEGEHEGWYWEYYLPEYLNFYSSALSATGTTPQGAPVVVSRPLVTAGGVSSQS
jgi:enterochelin esterase-like enzyme